MGKKSKAASSVIDAEDVKAFKAQAEELRKKGDELFAQSQCAAHTPSVASHHTAPPSMPLRPPGQVPRPGKGQCVGHVGNR